MGGWGEVKFLTVLNLNPLCFGMYWSLYDWQKSLPCIKLNKFYSVCLSNLTRKETTRFLFSILTVHHTQSKCWNFSPQSSLYSCPFQIIRKSPSLSTTVILCVYATGELPSAINRVKDILFHINYRNLAVYVKIHPICFKCCSPEPTNLCYRK